VHFKSLISSLCIRRGQVTWWQIGCPVSRVNTCICNYLLCDIVIMLIVLSCVSGCIHNYLLCDFDCVFGIYIPDYLLCDLVVVSITLLVYP